MEETDILRDPFCAMTVPLLWDFTHLSPLTNKQFHYSDSVRRDFLRALAVQNVAHPCDIYTLNKCEDKVQDGTNLDIHEMNANMSHNDFMPLMKAKG